MANVLVALESRSDKASGSVVVTPRDADPGDDGAVDGDFSLAGRGSG